MKKGQKHSEESRKRMCESMQKKVDSGWKHTHYSTEWKESVSKKTKEAMADPEIAAKHSLACKNRVVSEEGRRKQSIAQKKRYEWDIAPTLRPGVAEKISKSHMGKKKSDVAIKKVSDFNMQLAAALSAEERKIKYGYWTGKQHSEEYKIAMSAKNAELYRQGKLVPKYSWWNYKGIPMASKWEVRMAEWLDANNFGWEYQPIVFKLSDGRNYIPDFKLTVLNEFVEVKGIFRREEEKRKLNEFVQAGNILHLIGKNEINHIHLSDDTLWRVSSQEV